jgi:hypothetical protein
MHTQRSRIVLLFLIALAIRAISANGQSPAAAPDSGAKTVDKKADSTGAKAPATGGGVVVFKDPVTGKIRQPDASEIGELLGPAPLFVTQGDLQQLKGPGNAVGMMLDSSFHSYSVVTKGPDGKLVMGCVTGAKKAEDVVRSNSQGPAKPAGNKEASDVR